MLKRETLENYQVFVYLTAIAAGLVSGLCYPGHSTLFELLLWPVLALLLYSTFTQVPMSQLRQAFCCSRFMLAAVVGNFIFLPLIVWGLMFLSPTIAAVQLGIVLVLLVPCTDWFITFTHLGGGDTKSAIAFSPVSLVLQLVLLPLYIWLFLGTELSISLIQQELAMAFFGFIVLPLIAAFLTEKWVGQAQGREKVLATLGWFPVPLLGVVVFSIAAAQVNAVKDVLDTFPRLLLIFSLFLVLAALLSLVLSKAFKLPLRQGRVLAFSLGSRNSFVVLPLALALPASFDQAVVVIVFQSLVELFGMAIYSWWVPKILYPKGN